VSALFILVLGVFAELFPVVLTYIDILVLYKLEYYWRSAPSKLCWSYFCSNSADLRRDVHALVMTFSCYGTLE